MNIQREEKAFLETILKKNGAEIEEIVIPTMEKEEQDDTPTIFYTRNGQMFSIDINPMQEAN